MFVRKILRNAVILSFLKSSSVAYVKYSKEELLKNVTFVLVITD